jgi:hypothetical protein
LLSHIKAPAQGGKAGSSKLPTRNLSKPAADFNKAKHVYTVINKTEAFTPHIVPKLTLI